MRRGLASIRVIVLGLLQQVSFWGGGIYAEGLGVDGLCDGGILENSAIGKVWQKGKLARALNTPSTKQVRTSLCGRSSTSPLPFNY